MLLACFWFSVFCSENRKPFFLKFQIGGENNHQHKQEREKTSGVILGTFFERPNPELGKFCRFLPGSARKQIKGTHYNGTNTKPREAKRQKTGKLNNHNMGFGKRTPERVSSGTKKWNCAALAPALGHRPGSHKKKHGPPRCGNVHAIWAKEPAYESPPSETIKLRKAEITPLLGFCASPL